MQQINSILSTLKRIYDQQGWISKILFPGFFLLVFCFLCLIMISVLSSRKPPNVIPSPIVLPSQGIGPTPTPLFNFGSVTFTPFPTLSAPSALPTLTLPPTETSTPTATPILPTETASLFPTVTNPTATSGGSVLIVNVNKAMEYVELQNFGNVPVDLTGWKLVSETGNQSCRLRGVLGPNEVLRVWAGKGKPGLSCGFSFNIWNDSQSDPAVLYNAQGEEVSRVP